MNKADLIEALTPTLGSRRDATLAVDALVDVVLREVAAGGSVGITGFGTFERTERAPRTGRNPRTGQIVPIAGTRSPRFRPGTYFKKVVTDPSDLPEDGLAGGRAAAGTGSTSPEGASAAPRGRRASPAKGAARLVAAEDVAAIESQLKDSAKKTLKRARQDDAETGSGKAKSGKSKAKSDATKSGSTKSGKDKSAKDKSAKDKSGKKTKKK
ncbi:HU family DNA-binding protein [Ornithinimicrobium ciconiae]|uniref:HU family DNA-binding protein n=1 Tax=Ornithinimicrobium ciconiae TaxID=2594265 RepID=A0A516GCC5_9MICO|nr:HU family DNA-binding protein [Ornithinimicrobium ciconiae]QDO89174.1 HU family DNA-binding protein [Ornithinimicrobium ciconiae]